MTQDEFIEEFQETLTILAGECLSWEWYCNTEYNIHRDPRFLLQNPAPAAIKNFILKSDYTWHLAFIAKKQS